VLRGAKKNPASQPGGQEGFDCWTFTAGADKLPAERAANPKRHYLVGRQLSDTTRERPARPGISSPLLALRGFYWPSSPGSCWGPDGQPIPQTASRCCAGRASPTSFRTSLPSFPRIRFRTGARRFGHSAAISELERLRAFRHLACWHRTCDKITRTIDPLTREEPHGKNDTDPGDPTR
jgi:hypothetical protein